MCIGLAFGLAALIRFSRNPPSDVAWERGIAHNARKISFFVVVSSHPH